MQARRGAFALILCGALLGGCGGSKAPHAPVRSGPGIGRSLETTNCTDWREDNVDQRRGIVVLLRKFAGGQVGSSHGIQHGRVLDDTQAYRLLDSYCANHFARGFQLYKLYNRAAAFAGH